MFRTYEHFGFNNIELYILIQQTQFSHIIDLSQVFCEADNDEHTKVDVVVKEE